MPFPSSSRPNPWLSLLLALSTLAGCRSERAAFQFEPAPVVATAELAADNPTGQQEAARGAARQPLKRPARPTRPAALAKRKMGPAAAPYAVAAATNVLRPALRPRATAQAATQAAPADQGLGKIFWFAVLVVALVLAGLTWGVSAIFGIGFWKALGFLGLGLLGLLVLKGAIELLSGG